MMENTLLNSLNFKKDSVSSILKTINKSAKMGIEKTTSLLFKSLASSSQSLVSESSNSTSVNSTTLSPVSSVTSTTPSSISSPVTSTAKYEWSGVAGVLDWNKSKILNIITSQIQNTSLENPNMDNMDQKEENELENEDDIYENFEAQDAREVWPIFSRNIKVGRSWEDDYTFSVTVDTAKIIELLMMLVLMFSILYIWLTITGWAVTYVLHLLTVQDIPEPEEVEVPVSPWLMDVPPPYESLNIVVLPPSPSSASGSQPRKYVTEEPPTFHDAIVGMIFRDKKKKTPRLSRASSAESVLETLEKSPKNGEPAPVHSNPTLFERRFGRHIHMRNSIDVML